MPSESIDSSVSGLSDEQDAYPLESFETDSQQTGGVLGPLTQERQWQFSIESAEGEEIQCEGSEPETEDEVAQLIHPTQNAELLFRRSVLYLHDNPSISEDDWDNMTPTNKALISSKHLENWGVYDLISKEEIEEAKHRIINQ